MTQNAPFFVDNEVIVLNRQGIWLADGIEITHEPTRKLFSHSLTRDAEGYFLKVGRETKRITVEDTPYFVLRVDGTPAAGFELLLNDECRERLDPLSLAYRPGRLTCRVKQSSAMESEAKFLHAPYFDLLRYLNEKHGIYFLEIQGKKAILARQ